MLFGSSCKFLHWSWLKKKKRTTMQAAKRPLTSIKEKGPLGKKSPLSRQIYAVPDLCCIVTRRSVESVGGAFDPFSSANSNCGVWTGCGQRQCTPSRQQVARDETEEPLIPLSFPTRSLSFSDFSMQIGKVSAVMAILQIF